MIFVNYKSVYEATGERAIALTSIIDRLIKETGFKIIPVVHDFDLYPVRKIFDGELWLQHIDPFGGTGNNPAETVSNLNLNIKGTFLNHSEHQYKDYRQLVEAAESCRGVGLKTLIFAGNEGDLVKVAEIKPDYVAFEPPELVGSKESSVAKSKPESIAKSSQIAREKNVPLIVGAGVKESEDVKVSLAMGAIGVAVSSAVVFSEKPETVLLNLIEGFK